MREDREKLGLSIYEIAKKYGCAPVTVYVTVKDCPTGFVRKAAPGRKIVKEVTPVTRPNLSKSNLGEAARQAICAKLMIRNISVYRPMIEDTTVDLLIVTKSGKIKKCQCKYVYANKHGFHNFLLCSIRKNGPNSKAIKHLYTKEEVDFFLGYCLDNESVYVVPYEDVVGKTSVALWILRDPVAHNNCNIFDHKKYQNRFDYLE